MINFLTEQVNNDVWEKLFSFVVTTAMMVFDLMMLIKIPLTNVSLFYVLIFTMVVDLSIYAINGTSTNYNDLGSTIKNRVSKSYSSAVKSYKNVKRSYYIDKKRKLQEEINKGSK